MHPDYRSYTKLAPVYIGNRALTGLVNNYPQYLEDLSAIEELPADTAKAVSKDFKKLFGRKKN